MKTAALMFGLNYKHLKGNELTGCINDVRNMGAYLSGMGWTDVKIFTDDSDLINTSHRGMIQNIYQLSVRSWKDPLDVVWIHFSGHGDQKSDFFGEEYDNRDETICPSDFPIAGDITDDQLCDILYSFNPKTVVILVIDACHSGTMGDLKYVWSGNGTTMTEDTKRRAHAGRVTMISGCKDSQVSYDYGVTGGALTSALLQALKVKPVLTQDVFGLMNAVKVRIRNQDPVLTSSMDLSSCQWLLPTEDQLKEYQASLPNDPIPSNKDDLDKVAIQSGCFSRICYMFK